MWWHRRSRPTKALRPRKFQARLGGFSRPALHSSRLSLELLERREMLAGNWTVMVYICGDNSESAAAIADFAEIGAAGSTVGTVNIVAQVDTLTGSTYRGVVQTGDTYSSWTASKSTFAEGNLGELNMGDAATLNQFVVWARTNYSATNYALVLWDPSTHSADFTLCYDQTNADYLTADEVNAALTTLTNIPSLGLLALNVDMGGMTEIVYQLRTEAGVLVASEQRMGSDGFDYTAFLNALKATPTMSASGLASEIIDAYQTQYGAASNYTLAALSSTQIGSATTGLGGALENFSEAMLTTATPGDWAAVQNCRDATLEAGDAQIRDLGDFMQRIVDSEAVTTAGIKTAASAVLLALQNAIIDSYVGTAARGSSGLSVYLPDVDDTIDPTYNATHFQFLAQTQWDTFLGNMVKLNYATVQHVTSPTDDGSYATGDVIEITIQFNDVVIVNTADGTPRLALNTAATKVDYAFYVSGTGTNTLTFQYTVQAGDTSNDLNYFDTTSLEVNGGTIQDSDGHNADLTLPATTSVHSLGGNKAIKINPISWTVMVYMCADNDEEAAALVDFKEISDVGSDFDAVNIVVQIDRAPGYSTAYGDWTGTYRGIVRPGEDPNPSTWSFAVNLGEVNMGSAASLTSFITWARTNYSATNYVLIIWDPGTRSGGLCYDATDNDYLTPAELSAAIPTALTTLRVLVLNCDMAGMTEVAYQLRTSTGTAQAAYLVASEQLMPSTGLSYTPFLQQLMDLPTMTYDTLANNIVAAYSAQYGAASAYSLASINMAQVGTVTTTLTTPLSGALEAFANTMLTQATAADWLLVQTARDAAQQCGVSQFRDVGDFMLHVIDAINAITTPTTAQASIRTAAVAVVAELTTGTSPAVVTSYAGSAVAGSMGLSIYLPDVGETIDSTYNSTNLSFVANTQWETFLEKMVVVNYSNVLDVTSTKADGAYGAGEIIIVQVVFSDVVVVNTSGGTPTLLLETGTTDRLATYISGSGTTTLSFRYDVQNGDSSPDLDYANTTALVLNGGTIRDAGGNDANLTLAAPGTSRSLAIDHAIQIIAEAPTIVNVTSAATNGSFGVGRTIDITVQFTHAVIVTGSPSLTLETGTTDRDAVYLSGSGTNTLTFRYTVGTGDTSSDLDYLSATSLYLNGGSIRNAAGYVANLTLPAPGAAGSLAANKALVVDGIAPTVVNVTSSTPNATYGAGDTISIQVVFSSTVLVPAGGTPTLTLETGNYDRIVNYSSGSNSNTLIFTYKVQAGDVSTDLDYASITALSLNGTTIRDAAGNNAILTLPTPGAAGSLAANKALVVAASGGPTVLLVSTQSPTVNNSKYGVGATIYITVTFNAAVLVNGTPTLTLETGNVDGVATYDPTLSAAHADGRVLVFVYTVKAGDYTADLDYVSQTALSGSITDVTGSLDAVLTLSAPGAAGSLGGTRNIVIDTSELSLNMALDSDVAEDGNGTADRITVQIVGSEYVISVREGTSPEVVYRHAAIASVSSIVIIGSSDNDTIVIGPGITANVYVSGAGGVNTLTGPNQASTWTVTSTDAGTVTSGATTVQFVKMQNLTGGTNLDAFIFALGASITGNLSGGSGTGADTLNFSSLGSQAVVITDRGTSHGFKGAVTTASGSPIGGTFDNINYVIASSVGTTDSILGRNASSTWTIDTASGNSIYRDNGSGRTLGFSNFETITGGSSTDTFNLQVVNVALAVNGGAGSDTFNIGTGNLDTISARLTLTGGEGTGDAVNLYDNDTSNIQPVDYRVNDSTARNQVTSTFSDGRARTGFIYGVTYDDTMETVRLRTSSVSNTIYIAPDAKTPDIIPDQKTEFEINEPSAGTSNPDKLVVDFTGVNNKSLSYNSETLVGKWEFRTTGENSVETHGAISFANVAANGFNFFDVLIVSSSNGSGGQPLVEVVDADTGGVIYSFLAYESTYAGGVYAIAADLTGDGIPEIITAPGIDHQPTVKVFSLLTQVQIYESGGVLDEFAGLLYSFSAYDASSFRDGVNLAAGDVDGDGDLDIVTVASQGIAEVRVFLNQFDTDSVNPINTTPYRKFRSFEATYGGGGTVAVADVLQNGGGDEILVAAGGGMNSYVHVFDPDTFTQSKYVPSPAKIYTAFGGTFRGGLSIAVGLVNGDAIPDIIVAQGSGGTSQVQVLNGSTGAVLCTFQAYTDASKAVAVRVAARDVDGDGYAEVFTAQANTGRSRAIKRWDVETLSPSAVDLLIESNTLFTGFFVG